jgi:hypothetical protein
MMTRYHDRFLQPVVEPVSALGLRNRPRSRLNISPIFGFGWTIFSLCLTEVGIVSGRFRFPLLAAPAI